jgi:hypothetical protein
MTGFCIYLLAAFACYRPSELVNGPAAEAVSIFETFAAATRGYKLLMSGQILNSSYYPPMFYCSFFFIYLQFLFFVELLLFFLSFYFSIGIVFR